MYIERRRGRTRKQGLNTCIVSRGCGNRIMYMGRDNVTCLCLWVGVVLCIPVKNLGETLVS